MYHLHVKNISRREGRSAVAAAAYRAGDTLPNEKEEAESAFGGRRDVRYAEIRLPAHAPAWMSDRATLWNAVEAAEKRKDARLAKEIEFALPRELPRAAWLEVARAMADAYTARGHVVDLAIHDDDTAHNPHCHLMLTTRAIVGDGFGGKLREADEVAFVRQARALWEKIANAALGKAGSAVMIDARSYAARGIAKVPGEHRGPDAVARRARRREVARMAGPLDQDILEARRELLIERSTRERFPLLAARPDWPPEGRQPLRGMLPAEREELRRFWREVDRRVFGEPEREEEPVRELHPSRPREPESRRTHREVERDTERRIGRLETAMPSWRELHAAVDERMRAAGYVPGPLSDWSRVQEAMERFENELSAVRALDAENRELADKWRAWEAEQEKLRSVPGPSGDVIAQQDLEQAQGRMIAEVHGPDRGEGSAGNEDERRAAEQAVVRQAEIAVSDREAAAAFRLAPQEDRLDWLGDRAATVSPFSAGRESRDDRLDWLRDQPEPVRDDEERERDRHR